MTDYSSMSDDELKAAYAASTAAAPAIDYSKMSDTELKAAYEASQKAPLAPSSPTTGYDVAASGAAGVGQGMAGFLGAAGDLRNMASRATDVVGNKLGIDPSNIETLKNVASKIAPAGLVYGPTSEQVQHGMEAVTGEFHKPETGVGQYANTVGQFVGNPASYLSPGSMAAKGLTAAGAGVGSEAAGQFLKGTSLEPLGRLVGAMAGGHAVTGAPRVVTPNIISPEQKAMINVLQNEGIPLTAGDRTGNLTLKAVESQLSPKANETQNKALVQAAFNTVGEPIGERPLNGQNGAVDTMMNRIGSNFDQLQRDNSMLADQPLASGLKDIHTTYNETPGLYPKDVVDAVNGSIKRISTVLQKSGGRIAGEDFQPLRSSLSAAARDTNDPQRAAALRSVVSEIDDAMGRTVAAENPADIGKWEQARRDYTNGLVLQHWAGGAAQTPSSLAQSAKAIYGKNAYVRGRDDFSELAEPARRVMKQYQDSGTARRMSVEKVLSGAGAVGGALAGGQSGGGVEGGVLGLLLGEHLGGMVARPALRAAVMNPVSQKILANQLLPYRPDSSPTMIALVNAIRGHQ